MPTHTAAMPSVAYLLAFIALFANSHGLEDLDSTLGLLEKLEQEVEEQALGLRLLIDSGKKTLVEQHDLEHRRALARMDHDTENVLKEAAKRKCTNQLKQQIVEFRDSVDDRWDSCMKMTEKLIKFENMTLILYKDFISWRPTFCDAANKVTYCFKSGKGVIDEVTCAYDGMTGYFNDFNKIREEMVVTVHAVHELVLQTVSDFKLCFGSAQQEQKMMQLRLLDEGCPQKRGKLLTTML